MKSRRITAALLLAACGAGIRSTAKNDEGIPSSRFITRRRSPSLRLCMTCTSTISVSGLPAATTSKKEMQMFADETMLFAQTWFRHAEIFRDMDNDYGMVCMPKFLESSDYMTLVYDGTTVFVPPITSR